MKNILTISKWEVSRVRSRFSGKSRFIILAILLLGLVSAYLIYHQGLVICKGLYTIGVSADAPMITDKCFNTIGTDPATGQALLREKTIDLYVTGNKILFREDLNSQYAAGALQKYLERQELLRIANQYEMNRAFPLRIEVRYLEGPETNRGMAPRITELEETPTPLPNIPEPPSRPGTSPPVTPSASDAAVEQQLNELLKNNRLPEFKAEFVSENEIVIPSLMTPPIPLAQVIIAFLYIIPLFFVSVFFTSSFTEEKINRKLIVLLSTPVSRLEIILGKMLPYLVYSIVVIVGITLALKGNVLLGLAIFIPVMLFIFSIYLIVALTYRTFKDQTFFSVLALSTITLYLVVPAMFAGVNELSYISPLTLAVEMYRGVSFGIGHYFLATAPLYIVFLQVMFIGTRVFNEQYLMGFKPLHAKVAEALYLVIDKKHLNVSVLLLGLFIVPVVFVTELVSIVFVSNIPLTSALLLLMVVSAIIEEIAKSLGILVLLQNNTVKRQRNVAILSALAALGFLIGEKLLLFFALGILSESVFMSAVFGSGLLAVPLALHVASTCTVGLITRRLGTRFYLPAVLVGTAIHVIYNLNVIKAFL